MLSKSILDKVAEEYQLGKIILSKLIKGGNINYNFSVKTDKGDFIVRQLGYKLDGWFAKHKPFEFEVLEFLSQQDFPYRIPRMMRTKKGEYILKIEEQLFEVYPKIKGRCVLKPNRFQVKGAAKALATYHKVIRNFPGQQKELDDFGHAKWRYSQLRAVKTKTPTDKYMLKYIDLFENTLIDLLKFDRNKNVTVIHGDFNRANLLFIKNKLVGILDFENVEWAPMVQDFASGCTDGVMNSFVKEYKKYNSISSQEEKIIIPLKLLKICDIFAWVYLDDHKKKDRRIPMMRRMVKRLKENLSLMNKLLH